MSERDEMFGRTQGKGDKPRPTDLKKYRERFPAGMGKKESEKVYWGSSQWHKVFKIVKKG